MGKTRRKLYGRSKRRQRGGGSRWWVLLGALAALQGAHAEDPGLRDRIAKWWNSETIRESAQNSIDVADYITSMKWAPTSDLWTSEASVSDDVYAPPPESAKDKAEDVVAPYLLTEGATYTITGTLPGDIGSGSRVIFKRSYTMIDEDDDGNEVTTTMYEVQRESDVNDPANSERTYDVSADEVTLTPVKQGGRASRKQQRKTLRRKK
jgi:hypothetical protein